jgi:hypothetical protein
VMGEFVAGIGLRAVAQTRRISCALEKMKKGKSNAETRRA